ncbi:hypothetical protein PRIC2_001079 [Phytophthora ramorum]
MEVRVRLVFADDVGRHVQRQRGFSSCWYLVPKDAKLVGDLAYVLQREFGLRKTCPQGLELRLEELPVLATQSIRIVRDNDTIVVQCPLAEDVPASSDPSSESEEENNMKRRKRKSRGKKNEDTERVHKRLNRYQDVLKKVQERMSAEKKAITRDEESNRYDAAPKRKEKNKYEERWKRPYEIVATVLDKTTEKASEPDLLTKELAAFPAASAGSIRFQLKDIIAFKTLTLCLETCQPMLSEWQCGMVQSVDASSTSIELSKWRLSVTDHSLGFFQARSEGPPATVQTSEISELRYLSGPSYSATS